MVNIALIKGYFIESNEREFILFKKVGNNRKKAIGYYCEIENLLTRVIDMCLYQSNAKSIQELLDYHKEIITQLNKALTPLKIKVVSNG